MAGDPLGPAIVKGESEVLLPWFWVRKGHREATSPVQGSGHRSRGMAHSPRWDEPLSLVFPVPVYPGCAQQPGRAPCGGGELGASLLP